MLIFDFHEIGNNLLLVRKRNGLTQSEAAERAGISDRTYADIERGSVNMRIETLLRLCQAFNITPDEILTKKSEDSNDIKEEKFIEMLDNCSSSEKRTALELLNVYLNSIQK